ncbi:MAG TPA: AsmA family protein [Xanthobacteraceae bacterium]|nr:AsmA family protein [Xanthobacteraceae bacterium]
MQRTLLSAAIALILVLMTALVGPLFVDWGAYRNTLETEISRLTRLDVRIGGTIDVRLLPTPTLKLQQIVIGRPDGPAQVRAEVLRIELGLGALMRGQFVASDVALEAPEISLQLGSPTSLRPSAPLFAFDPDAVSIAHLAVEKGRVLIAGGSGHSVLLDRVGFSGEARSLLGPVKGEGSVTVGGESYLFGIAAGRAAADGAVKARLLVDTVDHVRIGDVDSSVWIERGFPHFMGTVQWSHAGGRFAQGFDEPWRVSARIQGDWAAAALESINLQYGPGDRAIQLRGHANLILGAKPELDLTLAATRIDLDGMLASATARRRPLVALRTIADNLDVARLPAIHVNIGISADAITLADAPLQYVSANLRGEGGAWDLDSLELRAPGGTQLRLSGHLGITPRGTAFDGQGRIEARDSRALVSWLTAGSDAGAFAGPFRAEGEVRLGGDSIVFDRVKAAFDRDTLEGDLAYFGPAADRPGRISATLSASSIDLDRTYGLVQRIYGDPTLGWPHEGSLSLNVGRTTIAGVEAKGTDMRLQFDEQALTVERLAIDDFGGTRIAGAGSFDIRTLAPRGAIRLDLNMRAADGVAALVEKFSAPTAAALRGAAPRLLPAQLRGSLTADAQAAREAGMAAGASLKMDGSAGAFTLDLQGVAEVPGGASLLATFTQLGSARIVATGHVDVRDGRTLVESAGLDRLLSVDNRAGSLNFKASGRLDGAMTATAQLAAGGLDVSIDGTLQGVQSQAATANLTVSVARANVRVPQAGTLPATLTARLNYADGAVALNEITGTVAGSDITGRLAIGLSPTMSLGGDVRLAAVDVPAVIAAAVGLPAQRAGGGSAWPGDPFAGGILGQFRGRIAVASGRTMLTPSLVAGNLHGTLNFGPSDIALDDFEADIAGGRVSGRLAFARDGDELSVRSRVKLTKADMTALIRGDRPPISGRLNLDAEIEGHGRSPLALIGSLQGKGFFNLEDGRFARLAPSAFDAVIRSVDGGLPIEAARIRERTEEALERGALSVQGDGAITALAGKATLTALRLRAEGADLSVSARYDLVTEALDAKLALVGPAGISYGSIGRPQIAVSLQGSIASPQRTLDIAALTDWLSTRAIAENTKRIAALLAARDARPTEPPQTQPPAAQPAAPAVSATPEPAASSLPGAKPEAPANPLTAATPATDAPAAAKPALPLGPPVAAGNPEAPAIPPAAATPAGDALAAAKPALPLGLPATAAKSEPPAGSPAVTKPEGDAIAAAKPVSPSDQPPARRDTAGFGTPGENLAPVNPRIAELDRAIAANPNDGAALAKRGEMFAGLGDYGSAIKDFNEVIRLRPHDANTLNNRCLVRAMIRDLQSALDDCNAALQLRPGFAEAFNNRCWTRAIIGDLQSALNDCNAALQLRPGYADALDTRAMISLKSGQPGKAIADYDAALRIEPNRPSSLYGRGIAKIRNNNPVGGNQDVATAKSIQANIAEEFASYGIR